MKYKRQVRAKEIERERDRERERWRVYEREERREGYCMRERDAVESGALDSQIKMKTCPHDEAAASHTLGGRAQW